MSNETLKNSSVLATNQTEINAAVLVLETNKKEGEEFVYFQYKTNDKASDLIKLKGVILASAAISQGVLGNDYEIMTIEDFALVEKIYENFIKSKQSCKFELTRQLDYYAKYKICSKSYLKNYLVSIILPFSTPDNIVKFCINEIIESFSTFFEKFDHEDVKKNYSKLLAKFCEASIFNSLIYSIPKEKEDYCSSPIIYTPTCTTTFNYNNKFPVYMVKPPLKDDVKSEIIEIVNSLNSDRSILQETLTLMDPPLFLKGCVLSFKGYIIYNTLSNTELENLIRLSNLYNIQNRNCSSPEVLICESLYINNNIHFTDVEEYDLKEEKDQNDISGNNKLRKSIVATIIAQRDFVLFCYLDILSCKMNSSFDPFYHKRAEDLLVGLLKKSFQNTLNKELNDNGISLNDNYKSIKTDKEKKYPYANENIKTKNNSISQPIQTRLNSRIKGVIDNENSVNVIHYSIYNDFERVINTVDLNIDPITLQDVYRTIFNHYALIQTNLNKLSSRDKKKKISVAMNYENTYDYYSTSIKIDTKLKMKITRENFLREVTSLKPFEMGIKLKIPNLQPVWVCCKIYENENLNDELNIEQFSDFYVCYLAYESEDIIDIDDFCQNLLLNEMFL